MIYKVKKIDFEDFGTIDPKMNGYIKPDGTFIPTISFGLHYDNFIKRKQVELDFASAIAREEKFLSTRFLDPCSEPDDLKMKDQYLVNELGFIKFSRTIDPKYGAERDQSILPADQSMCTKEALLVLYSLNAINMSESTELSQIREDCGQKLAKKLKQAQ